MPLSQATQDAFEPRLEHLLNEINRVHSARQNRLPSGTKIDHLVAQQTEYRIDEAAELALSDGMDYLCWNGAELLGIAPEHRDFFKFEDLELSEIHELLLTKVPGRLVTQCLELIKRARERQVWHVLAAPVLPEPQYHGDKSVGASADGRLQRVVKAPSPAFTLENHNQCNTSWSTWVPSHDTRVRPIPKTRVVPGQESYPGMVVKEIDTSGNRLPPDTHRVIYLEGCRLKEGKYELGRAIESSRFSHQLLYRPKVKIEGKDLNGIRMIDAGGALKGNVYTDATVVSGKGLTSLGGEWMDGSLNIGSGEGTFSAQFFFGTRICFEKSFLEEPGTILFRGCDFTFAVMDDETLKRLAILCDETCVFSEQQLKTLGTSGEQFSSHDAALDRLLSFAPGEEGRAREMGPVGIGRVPTAMGDDHATKERKDLEPIPSLKQAGEKRSVYDRYRGNFIEVVDERIFTSLKSESADHLPLRVDFFRRLSNFVRNLPKPERESSTIQKMLEFLFNEGEVVRHLLQFGSDISGLPVDLLSLPSNKRASTDSRSGSEPPKVYLGYSKKIGKVTSVGVDWGDKLQTIYYTELQKLREALVDLATRLYHYGAYLARLEAMAYEFPSVKETGSYVFKEFFHPNLPATVGEQGSVVKNNVELPTKGSNLLLLSGFNGKAGKTHFMDAIALSIAQAQSGAPCPGKIEVPADGLYDHVLILPNIRGTTGGKESGMMSRARVVLEEFLARVKGLANTDKPTRVFIGLDEIMMGVTTPDDALRIECNFLEELMTIEGVDATVTLISPDPRVAASLQNRFPQQIQILGPASIETPSKLVPVAEAAPCSPDMVLNERGLDRFGKSKPWIRMER